MHINKYIVNEYTLGQLSQEVYVGVRTDLRVFASSVGVGSILRHVRHVLAPRMPSASFDLAENLPSIFAIFC